jgi:hypothetical protein
MLPFDADALFASLAYYHATFWPLQWLALIGAAAAIALPTAAPAHGERASLLLLATAWLWVGLAWHIATFAEINFAAPIYGALFVVEGALLAWAAARGRVALRFRHHRRHLIGLGLALAALIGYPIIDRLGGVPWTAVRLPGAAPCPTALWTLGLLLLAEGRPPAGLMLLPVLWTVAAAATGWVLGIEQDQLLPLAVATALVVALWPERRPVG